MNEMQPYHGLVSQIGNLLQNGRKRVGKAVNTILLNTYWQVGKHIVEFEQHGKKKPPMVLNCWNVCRKISLRLLERVSVVQTFFKYGNST